MTDFARPNPAALWKGTDFASKDDVAVDLPRDAVAALLPSVRELAGGREAVTLSRDDEPMRALAPTLEILRGIIMEGRGFAILRGFPVAELSQREIECFYWLVGLHLGDPVSQSVMGDRLGHVIDVSGKDMNARAYRNSTELHPHSDPADILAFLCLHPAMKGGESLFSSSHLVHEIMRAERPDLLTRLYRGYPYHRFGEEPLGWDKITPHRVPVFSARDGHLSARLVRQYVEICADEYPEFALEPEDIEALDMFEGLAARDGYRFTLDTGEAIIANNYMVLHARSAFEDYPDEARKRHLLRLWLHADPPRPTVREIFLYGDGEPGIPPRPGSTPYYENRVELQ